MKLNELTQEVHKNAIEHGWWKEERSFGDIISLIHSELSEALEEYRNGNNPQEIYFNFNGKKAQYRNIDIGCEKPEGIPSELADVIIRVLDYCGKENIDIEEAIRIKHEYNKTRPYKHGGKAI